MIIKEIQGLRSLSVFIILLYHLNSSYFELGYLGVDVFFIVSGFIISKIILANIEKKNFSFIDYFNRRIRRLVPGLILVIFLVSILSWLYQIPLDLKYYGQSLFSTSIFLSNIYFYVINNDYFASNTFPLIHLWSLSLEVQFYIIYPILILFIYKFNLLKNKLNFIFFLITLVSFFFSINFSHQEELIFYILPSRFWEFLLGYFLYDLISKEKFIFLKRKNYPILFIGIIFIFYLIFGSSVLIKNQIVTAYIVFSLFILAYNKNNILNIVLTNSLSQIVAKYSYSVFLVHLPIIYFFNYFEIYKNTFESNFFIILTIIFFSIIIFKIENFYFKLGENKILNKSSLFLLVIILLIFSLIGLFFHYSKGIKFRYFLNNELDRKYISKAMNYPSSKVSLGQSCALICAKVQGYDKSLLLFGDSHAGDYEFEITRLLNNKKVNLYLSYYNYKSQQYLNELDHLEKSLINQKIDYVFIVNHKIMKNEMFLKKIDIILKNYPDTEFYYFLPRVEFYESPIKSKILNKPLDRPEKLYFLEINKFINSLNYKNFKVIDQNNLLLEITDPSCSNLSCFDGHDSNNFPLYRDNHHLTNYAADLVLKKVFNQLSLK